MTRTNLTATERRRLKESHGSTDPMFCAEAEEAMAEALATMQGECDPLYGRRMDSADLGEC